MFVDFALEQEQLDQGWRVLDGLLDKLQRLLVVLEVVVVLRHEVQDPEVGRGRFLDTVGLAVKTARRRRQVLLVGQAKVFDYFYLGLVLV